MVQLKNRSVYDARHRFYTRVFASTPHILQSIDRKRQKSYDHIGPFVFLCDGSKLGAHIGRNYSPRLDGGRPWVCSLDIIGLSCLGDSTPSS